MAQEHSKACCTIPPVVAKDYKEKGTWTTIAGLKTYVTGPSDAKRAILWIFDIFGYFPQTIQGADILASSKDSPYLVIMPDFFEGSPAKLEWYPPVTEEQKKLFGAFIKSTGDLGRTQTRIPNVVKEADEKYPTVEKWGVVGYCWGGKQVALSSQSDSLFVAGAQSSPAFVDPEDAAKIMIPMLLLPSKDEDVELVKKYDENLKVKKLIKTYDQVHGFMSARADFEEPSAKAAYEDGYTTLLNFFNEHLS